MNNNKYNNKLIWFFGVARCRYIPHVLWNYKECIYMYIICKHLFYIYENIEKENCFFQDFRRKIYNNKYRVV